MLAKRGAVSTKTYTVGGKTLADILKDMEKKGPPDPNEGKRYSGSCLGKLTIAIAPGDFEFDVAGSGGKFAAKARLKGGSVTSSAVITAPKLASDKDLSSDAKKEWNRFVAAVGIHERGHADSYYALAVTVAKDIVSMTANGTGSTEKAAKLAANKALVDQISKKYGGNAIDNLIKADAKAYDAKTKHGESQGAVLKASIS